jgi:hypothetical protein
MIKDTDDYEDRRITVAAGIDSRSRVRAARQPHAAPRRGRDDELNHRRY